MRVKGNGSVLMMAVAASLTALASACLPQDKSGDLPMAERRTIQSGGGDVLGTFESGFHAFARVNCASCHGGSQNPKFAVADVSQAYQAARPYVDFSDIDSSDFVRKSNDGHCGGSCLGNSQIMLGHLSSWKAAEDSASSSGGGGGTPPLPPAPANSILSAPLTLPSPLPGGNTYSTVRMNLGQVTPSNPDLNNVVLQFEVQRFSPSNTTSNPPVPGSFKLRRPRIGTTVNAIYVKNMRFKVNGVDAMNANDWADIDTAVAPGAAIPAAPTTIPYPSLTANDAILIEELTGPQPNQITITFERLERTTAAACKDVPAFVANAKPVLQNRCYGCHQNTGNTGYQRFSMGTAAAPLTDAELCSRSLQRVVKATPSNSPLIANPLSRAAGHPGTAMTSADADNIILWINRE